MPRIRDIPTTLTAPVGTEWLPADPVSGNLNKITYANARAYFASAGGSGINVKDPAYGAVGNHRTVSDGVISSGALSTLTSATAVFTAGDVGRAVTVAGAGVGATLPTLGNLPHSTTISAYTNATTVTLAAPAANTAGVSAARVDLGTDDSAAFQAAITAAYAVGGPKAVYVPPGSYMVPTTLNVTSSLAFRGGGRGVTTIVHGAASHGFNITAPNGSTVEMEDFTLQGPTGVGFDNGTYGIGFVLGSGFSTRFSVRRVTVLGTFDHAIMRSGGGYYELDDCHLEASDVPTAVFDSTDTADSMFFLARGSTFTTPNGDLSSVGSVGIYIHPHVPFLISNCRFITIGRYGIYQNGSPTATRRPSAVTNCEFVNCEMAQTKGNGRTTFTGCVLKGSSNGMGSNLLGNEDIFSGCVFENSAPLHVQDGSSFKGCTFTNSQVSATTGCEILEIGGCLFRTTSLPTWTDGTCVSLASTVERAVIDGCEFVDTSTAGLTGGAIYAPSTTVDARVTNCRFRGFRASVSGGLGVVFFRGVRLFLDGCEFDNTVQGTASVLNVSGAVGRLEGSNNVFRGTAVLGTLEGTNQQRMVRRPGVNPTAVASAATIDTNTTAWLNYDTHVVTGSAAIATLSNPYVAVGTVRLVVAAAGTWSTANSGNITPLTTAARTAGTVVTLLWEPTAAKWLEV